MCRVRARTKASLRTFKAVPCRGLFKARAHASHKLRVARGLVWCSACGAYAVEKMVGLARACPGAPPSAAAGQRLAKLRGGIVPPASVEAASAWADLAPRDRHVTSASGVHLRLQPEVAASRAEAAGRPV